MGRNGGGGVFIMQGTFTMDDGEISDNSTSQCGGGVYISESGSFVMKKGKISGNTANKDGGGIFTVDYNNLKTDELTVFSGNQAGSASNYGLANKGTAGLGGYPAILWTGDNSIPGTHLLNNYDVNYEGLPIGPPADVMTVAGDQKIGLRWKDPDTGNVAYYEVSIDGGDWKAVGLPALDTNGNRQYVYQPLENGKTYTFTVRAVNIEDVRGESVTVQGIPKALGTPGGSDSELFKIWGVDVAPFDEGSGPGNVFYNAYVSTVEVPDAMPVLFAISNPQALEVTDDAIFAIYDDPGDIPIDYRDIITKYEATGGVGGDIFVDLEETKGEIWIVVISPNRAYYTIYNIYIVSGNTRLGSETRV
jgi:hypothetical protein